jgi:hypothetical protein
MQLAATAQILGLDFDDEQREGDAVLWAVGGYRPDGEELRSWT